MILKSKRSRSVDEITEELRTKIKQEEPAVDVEFVQVLQDMIGDLSNAPEPIQIKLFSPDAALLSQWAPRDRRCHSEGAGSCGRSERY